MDLAAAFIFFAGTMIFVLSRELPMSLAMFAGFIAFMITGLRRGFTLRELLSMSLDGAKESLIVVRVLLTIGILTGLWRSSGTFAVLTAWGLRSITPSMFVLAAFILSCILSYALGTSFGTAGTLGVALMTLARAGGVNEIITAGAIMSGIHFGDRGSPASSCAHLVTSLTGTDLYGNIKRMMKTALIPLLLSVGFYFVLSFMNPLTLFDSKTPDELSLAFDLNPLTISPALFMIILPFMKINIFIALLVSIISAFMCTLFIQGYDFISAVYFAVMGFHSDSGIKALFNGGGLISMIQMCIALEVSGTYAGIFNGTGMLDNIQEKISGFMNRFGAYHVILLLGTLMDAIFCNQTVGVMMTAQLMKEPYESHNIDMNHFALDISNSTVITAPLVPWCMACSVPLGIMNVSVKALPYACYLYLIPVCYMITKRPPANDTRGHEKIFVN